MIVSKYNPVVVGRTTVKDEVKSPAISRIPGERGVDEDEKGPTNYTRNVELRPTLTITRRSRSSSPTHNAEEKKVWRIIRSPPVFEYQWGQCTLKLSTS